MLPAANMIRTASAVPAPGLTAPSLGDTVDASEAWTEIRDLLKKEGVAGISAGHYLQESVMAGGCGAKLDPRDFGKKGKIDRDIYYIRVRAADADWVREILRRNGITAGIDEDLMTDAALKKRHSYI